jgi:UDP:flavonoid glycosyltransferase YjiC (YdhE family)
MWAELVRGLGCAGDVIPYKELTSERLGAAIQATLMNSELRQHAADFAVKINAEQGLNTARRLIEQLLAGLTCRFSHDDNAANIRRTAQQQMRARRNQPIQI